PTTYNLQPKVVFTAHGWGFYEDRSFAARAAIFLASFAASWFQDALILINTADFRAAKRFIPRRKLHLIFNGIDDIDFLPRPAARNFFAQKIVQPITNNTLLIGVIAELTRNKGLTYLIDALHHLSLQPTNYKLQTFIIGEGEQRRELETKIKKCGLEKTITLLGFNTDARAALAGIDIFVLPSLKEGLPYGVMEAMAAGLPVIATRVGGLTDLITDNTDGLLVSPKDSNALARAITLLIRDADLRARLGIAAHEKIKTTFRFHAMMEHTISLYRSLAP
ncbi:MAG: glycosyltransferase family 4 protein, partial [Candidatus Sungiibacteriota bacterium]